MTNQAIDLVNASDSSIGSRFPTSVKIDPALKDLAKSLGLNLRVLLEQAIREEVKKSIVCPMCGRHD